MQQSYLERPPKRSSLAAFSPLRPPWLIACCRSRASCSMLLSLTKDGLAVAKMCALLLFRMRMVLGLREGHHEQATCLLWSRACTLHQAGVAPDYCWLGTSLAVLAVLQRAGEWVAGKLACMSLSR